MKAGLIRGGVLSLGEVDIPSIGPFEILVRMRACGVCGTDIEKIHGKHITPPVLGHEVAGDIVKVGKEVRDYEVGDRVAVHHHVPCYACHYCRHGDYTMCESFSRTNLDPCGFAEYIRVPETNVKGGAVLKLPEGLTYKEGALLEPTGCCIRALEKCKVQPGDDGLVIGAGPVGLTHVQLLRSFGAGRVMASDIIDRRLKVAERFGADAVFNPRRDKVASSVNKLTHGRGVDLVVVATSSVDALKEAIGAVRRGGKVVLFGAPEKGAEVSYDISDVFIREVSLIPSYSTTEIEMNMAMRLAESKRINLTGLISHRFKLEAITQAFRRAQSEDAIKVMIEA